MPKLCLALEVTKSTGIVFQASKQQQNSNISVSPSGSQRVLNIKQMRKRQPDLCYSSSLQLLSEVTVSDLRMRHVGVDSYSIHSPLCVITEDLIQQQL